MKVQRKGMPASCLIRTRTGEHGGPGLPGVAGF